MSSKTLTTARRTVLKSMPVTVALLSLTGPPARHSSGKYKGKSKVSNKANKKVNGARSGVPCPCGLCSITGRCLSYNIAKKSKNIITEKSAKVKTRFRPPMRLVINNVCNNGVARAIGTPNFCLCFSKIKI